MSEQAIQSVVFDLGAQAGTVNKGMWRVPKSDSAFGGVTLLNAYIISGGAATSVLQLNNFGTALGTAISSNIGTLNATLVANVKQAFSITTAYQASGTWVGVSTGAGGSLDAATSVILEYKWGK
jgi:hypothetical protein